MLMFLYLFNLLVYNVETYKGKEQCGCSAIYLICGTYGIFLLRKRFYYRIVLPSVRTLKICIYVPLFGASVPGRQKLCTVVVCPELADPASGLLWGFLFDGAFSLNPPRALLGLRRGCAVASRGLPSDER